MANHRSYRCSSCNEDWPLADRFRTCPRCKAECWKNDDAPDHTHSEAQAIANETPYSSQLAPIPPPAEPHSSTPAHANRVERYLHYGFSEVDAELLAAATTTATTERRGRTTVWVSPLHHLKVAEALAGGMTHAMALAVFA